MKKLSFFIFPLLMFLFLVKAPQVWAVCPACTIAVGAGVGLSRWLGIDDLISGLWVGAFTVSCGLWFASWLGKRHFKFPAQKILSILLFYLVIVLPLFFFNIIGHPLNKLWGIDKLLIGIGGGSVIFLISVGLDKYLRIKNKGKVLFYYQKVILPIGLLLITSLILYFWLKGGIYG
jgi:hypothetical protein